ncbi:MAG TPA: ABC transporter ATPase [Bacteroidia bacterium]
MNSVQNIAPHSRVWIYQSDKEFNASQLNTITELKSVFLEQWESHEVPIKGAIEVLHNRFILILIDETSDKVCGGSVDSSVRFMKELEKELGVSLLNRMLVAYKKDGKIFSCTLPEFESLAKKGEVNKDTIVFNNSVHTFSQFENEWEVPAEKSWHKNFIL